VDPCCFFSGFIAAEVLLLASTAAPLGLREGDIGLELAIRLAVDPLEPRVVGGPASGKQGVGLIAREGGDSQTEGGGAGEGGSVCE